MTKSTLLIITFIILLGTVNVSFSKEVSFTQEDRDKLIRLETTMKEFKDSINMRFEQLDKRFEQLDKRFEQVDKRLEFMQNLMIGMLAVFGSLCGVFVGLLLWDRKTFKEKAKEEAMREIEQKWRIGDWIGALKEYGTSNKELAEILKKCHLL